MATIRALLLVDLIVGICGLAVAATAEPAVRTNQQVAPEAAALGASLDHAIDAISKGGAPLNGKARLSAAEFAIALRAGQLNFAAWDPESKVFIVR